MGLIQTACGNQWKHSLISTGCGPVSLQIVHSINMFIKHCLYFKFCPFVATYKFDYKHCRQLAALPLSTVSGLIPLSPILEGEQL